MSLQKGDGQDEEELSLLRQSGCPSHVIDHCLAVKETALRLASQVKKVPIDRELVRRGALLHDIGRSKCHTLHHAVEGAAIARALGLEEALVRIVERHIGAGITTEEAVKLGLPAKDYVPETVEEKIVSYADNIVVHTTEVSFAETLNRFTKLLGPQSPALMRLKAMDEEIRSWMGQR